MIRRVCVWILLVAPLSFGASKEIQELQRDVAQLQDQLRQLQASQDKQLAAITALVQSAIDSSNRASTSAAVIQNSIQQSLRDMENKVATPVVGLNTRINDMANDVRTTQQAVADLTTLINKMQAQLTDLGNAVKVMQAPAPPPPGSQGGTAPAQPGQAQAQPGGNADIPPIPASDLYSNASRDYNSGKRDMALQEFNDYLKWYGNTDLAPNAQFYVGMIHYGQGDFDSAANDFDMVLEKYSRNPKTADAMYYKGMSLLKSPGHRTEAGDQFKELIKAYPNTDRAKQACTELTKLGYNTCRFPASAPKRTAKKR
jgi:tol-pal system protein YbgF